MFVCSIYMIFFIGSDIATSSMHPHGLSPFISSMRAPLARSWPDMCGWVVGWGWLGSTSIAGAAMCSLDPPPSPPAHPVFGRAGRLPRCASAPRLSRCLYGGFTPCV